MSEELALSLRAKIFGGELELLKGLIAEHSLVTTGDLESLTRPQAVQLIDNWFQQQLKGEDKGLVAIESILFTFDVKSVVNTESTTMTEPSVKVETKEKSVYRKELKISGQIDCKAGISYMSLRRQIESALMKGYVDIDIIDAVIKAIPPTSGLRRYLEGKDSLDLSTLRNILRAHYNEKTGTELFNELGQATQGSKETPTDFLMRTLDLKQKILFASQESAEEMKYSKELVEALFSRTVITGLTNSIIRQEFKSFLEQPGVKDEELIDSLNKIVSRETERQNKLGKVKVSEVRETKSEDRSELNQLRCEVSALREAVQKMSSSQTTGSDRKENIKTYHRLCKQCEEKNLRKCNHCWKCGSTEHFRRGCRKVLTTENFENQGNSSRSHPGGTV